MACLMRRATWLVATAALLAAAGVNGQGFETGQGLLPSGWNPAAFTSMGEHLSWDDWSA